MKSLLIALLHHAQDTFSALPMIWNLFDNITFPSTV